MVIRTGAGTLAPPCTAGKLSCNGALGWTCKGGELPATEVCDSVTQQRLKESLKNYLMIKNNSYLNRARKVPTEDDILKCECVPANAIPK